jgi:hypothetical protein
MGLNFVLVVILVGLLGCMAKVPAIDDKTYYYDCCDPAISADAKLGCKVAPQLPNHTIVDENSDRYKFIWSDCETGKEPWRKYE